MRITTLLPGTSVTIIIGIAATIHALRASETLIRDGKRRCGTSSGVALLYS
jgi:hypothetical protein